VPDGVSAQPISGTSTVSSASTYWLSPSLADGAVPTPQQDHRGTDRAPRRFGAALFAPILTSQAQSANNARFLFLDPAAPEFYPGWERQAQDVVAMLRTEAGRSPHDKGLSNLIGELSTRSENFRTWWAAQRPVPPHRG
jgi:transcription regulator MmyB-like protein